MLGRFAFLLVLLGTVVVALVSAHAAEFTVERNDRGLAIELDGALFTEYLIKNGPKPILWPIIGPTGKPMTRAYPMQDVEGERKDHPHHRSLWFTHGEVGGVDFWSESSRAGSIVHREFLRTEPGRTAVIETTNDWMDRQGNKVCEDRRTLTFRAGKDWRSIDFDITITASERSLEFGDTKEGSFGVRVPTEMDVDSNKGGHIANSNGQTDRAAWGKRAAWVDCHGPIDGQVVGIAVMNHPSSFRYPTYWHVRTYGLFAANPFGWHDFEGTTEVNGSHTLESGESITLRYRVLLHTGDEKVGKVAKAFETYASEP